MQLTNEMVQRCLGGQCEVQNRTQDFNYRGEISSIALEGTKLVTKFSWLAKREGRDWVKHDLDGYCPDIAGYECELVGSGEVGGPLRIEMYSKSRQEFLLLHFPTPNGLDPKDVKGLQA